MKTIALYPGSFNPFHIGHLNILNKADRIFGKDNVVIAFGVNPDKEKSDNNKRASELEDKLTRKVITYSKFLHELIEDYECEGFNVVIIRGLRNGADLNYEVNQMRYIDDFKKGVNIMYLTCDKEYEHISSSAVRKINEIGGDTKKYLI